MEIHSIDGYGTDAYVYLQVKRNEIYAKGIYLLLGGGGT